MESYEFFDKLLLRVPRLKKEVLNSTLQEVLDRPAFRDALYLASDSVFEELKKRDFQVADCSRNLQQALQKYHHRICYRPTPFGGFSSVSQTEWSVLQTENRLTISEESFITRFMEQKISKSADLKEALFQTNPSMYAYGNNLRLYEGLERDKYGTRIFNLNEIESEGLPKELIIQNGRFAYEEIVIILFSYGLNANEADSFLMELLENHVLNKISKSCLPEIKILAPEKLRAGKGSELYAYTSHKTKGFVDKAVQAKIRSGIHCLEHLSVKATDTSMEKFKQQFSTLFDRREVPLLLALDPEAGIDYGLNAVWNSSLGKEVVKPVKALQWSKVHELLLSKWTLHLDKDLPVIHLNEEDLQILEPVASEHRVPGMMVLFSMISKGIHLHAAGGVSALNVLGRFTIFDDELMQIAKDISRLEQEANPEVVFAELLHDSDERTDKLNTRKNFREYVIPVVTDSGNEEEYCLELNDLYLSLTHGKLILRSRKLNKRVIPRLGTAYNYRRDSLSVYRFLCDLQNEGIRPNLNFSMSALFPGMPFYPAVYYEDVLLEAASWHLNGAILKSIYNMEEEKSMDGFLHLAKELQLPDQFMYVQQDQRLLLRRECKEDIYLLVEIAKNQKTIVLKEYHEDIKGLVRDEKGKVFAHELIAFLINRNSVYQDLKNAAPELEEGSFCLMEEWFYLKIYMHPSGMESFLLNHISPFIELSKKRSLVDQWFFIRYHDTDHHLRIRIKCERGKELLFMPYLQNFLLSIKPLPNIRTVELASYDRELERYAVIGIIAAEDLFCLSTELVLQTIRNMPDFGASSPDPSVPEQGQLLHHSGFDPESETERLISGLIYLNSVFQAIGFDTLKMLSFSKDTYTRLFIQVQVTKELKIKYDQEYRPLSTGLSSILKDKTDVISNNSPYYSSLAEVFKPMKDDDRHVVLTDLNHLHLNRLFPDDPCGREALCYYYFYKILLKHIKVG
jgi:lantibiotic biosynthesis protein